MKKMKEIKAAAPEKVVRSFNKHAFDNQKSKYNFDFTKLKQIRQILNESGLNVSGKDLEALYKARFSHESIVNAAVERYRKEKDILTKELLEERFIQRMEQILRVEATLNEKFLDGNFEFEITDEEVKETDHLERIREGFTTYFTPEGLDLYRRKQALAEEMKKLILESEKEAGGALGIGQIWSWNFQEKEIATHKLY